MADIGYLKRKNDVLFKSMEEPTSVHMKQLQNYIPIYSKFFSLNESNFNGIQLNHKWYLSSILKPAEDDCYSLFHCSLKNADNGKKKQAEVFFKMAPLLEPFKYLTGKLDHADPKLRTLPTLSSTDKDCHPKFLDTNNCAYIDGFFLFLSSQLIHRHGFVHGVDYYGSFLGMKQDFVVDVYDDIHYLHRSDFFNKHKNILFAVDDYEYLLPEGEMMEKKKPIQIDYTSSIKSHLSAELLEFEDVFTDFPAEQSSQSSAPRSQSTRCSAEEDDGLEEITEVDAEAGGPKLSKGSSMRSNSTCSSRSSHTNDEEELVDAAKIDDLEQSPMEEEAAAEEEEEIVVEDYGSEAEEKEEKEEQDVLSASEDEDRLDAIIQQFPVQVICMESCHDTLDNLMFDENLSNEELLSAFMQIIMILVTYQKVFSFTHNDLHTNNVMYKDTDRKYLYYQYEGKCYKVPTFGRIFKIIDFGRSIYKFKGQIFCSDSFQAGNEAATQYNTEPYFNEKKPRLEPNPSFDLCRLACSMFDFFVEDLAVVREPEKIEDPVTRIVVEWCLDDKGINMLYKNNGMDRYPDFKLYKMIARCVHNHTPQAQLLRPEFRQYEVPMIKKDQEMMNIDSIPSCV